MVVWSIVEILECKARQESVPVRIADLMNTSDECPRCHNIGARSRPTRNQFKCTDCGCEAMTDHVAATNLAARAAVNQPIVAPPLFSAVTSHTLFRGGSSHIGRLDTTHIQPPKRT
ncbi:MAG TPA: zinc ribbon domain-containing protein [Nitrososphaera sp.]